MEIMHGGDRSDMDDVSLLCGVFFQFLVLVLVLFFLGLLKLC